MFKVIFDCILGRLRQESQSGGETPDPTPLFTVTTTPASNVRYEADSETNPGLVVTVTLRFNGTPVNADNTPSGWTRTGTGTYQRTLSGPGTVPAQAWSYTPGGIYGTNVAVKSSPARSLSAVYPAYWGIYPSNDAVGDISAAVASIAEQHRLTANMPQTTVEVPNPTGLDCYLWIVTRGSAFATPEAFDINMLRDPVTGKTFASPMPGADYVGLQGLHIDQSGRCGSFFRKHKTNHQSIRK